MPTASPATFPPRGPSSISFRLVPAALALLWIAGDCPPAAASEDSVPPANSELRVHTITSEYQPEPTKIRVLVPDNHKPTSDQPLPIVFVLPVEARDGSRYGDGLEEVRKHDLHNKHRVVCVAPTFAQVPWYADHPTNPKIRHESHFLRAVLPLVDKLYGKEGAAPTRYLIGFSKSGWGAWSLLLRNPKLFERSAAWDAPMTMTKSGYGSAAIFGTQENFEKHRIATLLEKQADLLRKRNRLVLTGYDKNFRSQHIAIHELMKTHSIPHDYRDGPHRKHRWDTGWLPEAFELLLATSPRDQTNSKIKDSRK